MLQQIDLFADAPVVQVRKPAPTKAASDAGRALRAARARGEAAAQAATRRAVLAAPDFRERARAHILAQLAAGPMSSEDLTDSCAAAGIIAPDPRAFGSIYSGLAREGLIVYAGDCKRRKGNGTRGGSLWKLPEAGNA